MRIATLLFAVIWSFPVNAWECGEYDKYEQPLEKHLELASDVVIGDVVKGEVGVEARNVYDVKIVLRPTLTLKGNISKDTELYTSSHSPFYRFELGGTYAVFLYGKNEVSFCNLVLPFWNSIDSLQDLENYVGRKDIEGIEKYRPLLEYARP